MTVIWRFLAFAVICLGFHAAPGLAGKPMPDEPPMSIAIVRYSSVMCEPVCPQWISAEGQISSATPSKLKQVLKSAGKLHLPILIQSGGGDVRAALQMGRLIRKSGLDVAVGWTLFRDPCKPGMKGCKLAADQNNMYSGFAFTSRSYCNSACNLILAGGVRRMAGPSAFVGAHQILTNWTKGDTIYYREKYRIVNHKKKVLSRTVVKRVKGKTYTTNGLYKGLRKELTAYLNEMGVSLDLFNDMDKAPPTSIFQMPVSELERLKLTNSLVSGDQLLSFRICKTYPLVPYCVFKMPLAKKL